MQLKSLLLRIKYGVLVNFPPRNGWRHCWTCYWQWLWNVQGRIRWGRCSSGCLPIHRWPTQTPGRNTEMNERLLSAQRAGQTIWGCGFCRVWWWAWDRKNATWETRPRWREASWPWGTQSSMGSLTTGTTWRGYVCVEKAFNKNS